ncbi:hypothetical protein [Streptomyces sp. bgisy022]|uniref:hypothetical protein n=1 Tax=Streptomyces sp. bgisy022 TaxID=3413769 RepID=UPI003D73BA54
MTPEEPGVRIGNVTGSTFAVGSHARAVGHHHAPDRADDGVEELLRAVRELRADLARVRQSEQTAQLDEALADTEDEIDRTGAVGEPRRRRVRELLTDAQALTAVLASAATVAGLLGM